MTTTFVKTGECRKAKVQGAGEVAEILNRELCGAQNVLGMLRWLGAGDRLEAEKKANAHQLIYLMEGQGVITLEKKDYEVGKGAGIYLGPSESASIRHAGSAPLKLFHLVVPKLAA
jgi:mannose-6-phosphate isomerase-like protein (cupin superfamily)